MRGLSLVAASGSHSSSRCAGLPLSRPLLLWSTGSRRAGSVIVAHGPSSSAVCGIIPDQGSNPCLLHWQADSQPLRHQGSPHLFLIVLFSYCRVLRVLCKGSSLSTTWPAIVIIWSFLFVCFFNNSHSNRYEVIPPCDFNLRIPDE